MAIVRLRKTSSRAPARGPELTHQEPDTLRLRELSPLERPLMPPLEDDSEMPPLRQALVDLYRGVLHRMRPTQASPAEPARTTLEIGKDPSPAAEGPAEAGPPSEQA